MKIAIKRVALLAIMLIFCNCFVFAQEAVLKTDNSTLEKKAPATAQAPVFGEHPDIAKYKALIQKEPDNWEYYLSLANLYASQGEGDLAVEYAQKAINLDAKAAVSKDAYMIAAMGSYYAGKPKQSYEYVTRALQAKPGDKIAAGFKNMLDSMIKEQWQGQLPENITFGDYNTAAEAGRALMKRGAVHLGDQEDRFISEDLRFKVKSPVNWFKASEFLTPKGARALIIYAKSKENPIPMVAITKDAANPEDKTVLDFSAKMKGFLYAKYPQMSFDGPYPVTVNGESASRMRFKLTGSKGELHTEWYQFLHNQIVITLEYTNWKEQFDNEYANFKQVVDSFTIE